jgi:hypothetical protein
MSNERQDEELRDQYRHPGFTPSRKVEVASWDEDARIICLTRRSKKQSAAAVRQFIAGGMIVAADAYVICPAVSHVYFFNSMCDA